MNNNNPEINETESPLSALNQQMPAETNGATEESHSGMSVTQELSSETYSVEAVNKFPDLSAFSFELPPLDAIGLPLMKAESSSLPVELPDAELKFTDEEMPDMSMFDRFMNTDDLSSSKALLDELLIAPLPDLPYTQTDADSSLDSISKTDGTQHQVVEGRQDISPTQLSALISEAKEEHQETVVEETPVIVAASFASVDEAKRIEIDAKSSEPLHMLQDTFGVLSSTQEETFKPKENDWHSHPENKDKTTAQEELNSNILETLIADIDRQAGDYFKFEEDALISTTMPDVSVVEEQHVIFILDDTAYSVPINNVAEIGRPLKVTSLPNVPSWVLGVANLRGDIVSVVDFRAFLGKDTRDSLDNSRMMIVRSQKENIMTALVVDKVREIRHLAVNKISKPTAPVEDRIIPFMRGVYEHNGRLLVLLDAERLMLSPEMQQFELSGN